jgi:single-strand DNA-binding protein
MSGGLWAGRALSGGGQFPPDADPSQRTHRMRVLVDAVSNDQIGSRDPTSPFEDNLAYDPQVRLTPVGKQITEITEITVLVNQRRQDSDGAWVDEEPTRHVVRAFKTLAENSWNRWAKGDRVFVHGTVTTDVWADKQSGETRTAQRVLAEIMGRPGRGRCRGAG